MHTRFRSRTHSLTHTETSVGNEQNKIKYNNMKTTFIRRQNMKPINISEDTKKKKQIEALGRTNTQIHIYAKGPHERITFTSAHFFHRMKHISEYLLAFHPAYRI